MRKVDRIGSRKYTQPKSASSKLYKYGKSVRPFSQSQSKSQQNSSSSKAITTSTTNNNLFNRYIPTTPSNMPSLRTITLGLATISPSLAEHVKAVWSSGTFSTISGTTGGETGGLLRVRHHPRRYVHPYLTPIPCHQIPYADQNSRATQPFWPPDLT